MILRPNQALPVWWSFIWRLAVYSVAASFLIRLTAYLVGKSGSIDLQGAMNIANAVTAASFLPVSFMAIRQALSIHIIASDA